MTQRLVISIYLFLFSLAIAISQTDLTPDRLSFDPQLDYATDIKSPAKFLGYELGESFTLYANAVQYFQYLADQSDRIQINSYGETYEGRKLYTLVISSPENLNNIDQIKADNLRLSDPRNISDTDAQKIIENKPVFVSYSYNIHGNEASSTEAAMQVSYRLAAVNDTETKEILDNAVMIFYICINPDGRDRYVYWYESMKRSVPGIEPRDLDHYAPWPNGRTNHYWFDLNRDWIWGIHPESRGHTGEYVKWMPQVHTDYHEQGYNANYFTVPGTTPRNMLIPDDYESLADTIGRANIAAFDDHKISYFTREAFDFFYPGYGSSYPTVMNAIGMLTEQGGIGGGRAITTNDGYILTLRQRVFDHYTTSMATIKKSVAQKKLFNEYFYHTSNPNNSKTNTKAYVLPNNDKMYLPEVINVLLHHKIEVKRTDRELSVSGLQSYRSGEIENVKLPKGSFIIHTDQPKHLFINSILSKQMTIEDSVMYDMATWSAPIAYNLDAYSSTRVIDVSTTPVTERLALKGTLVNPDARYAYVIDWQQRYAPTALSMLWEKGYKVRSAEESFGINGQDFHPGTLIVLLGRNMDKSDQWLSDMRTISEEAGVTIQGLHTGRMDIGNDLASRKSVPLHQPKVALLVENPFNTYTCGQLYYLFDQETKLPVERVRTSILEQTAIPKLGSRYGYADLMDYDVLILAGGGNNLSQLFSEKEQAQLKQWVQGGGTIIATESAGEFFTKEKSQISNTQLVKAKKDTSEAAKYLPYADRTDYYGKKRVPGSAMSAHIDTSHPLAYGVKEHLYSLSFGSTPLMPSSDLQTVGYYEKDPSKVLISGYAPADKLDMLAGNTFAGVDKIGRGQIVYLLDNTQYRMFWRGPSRMMQNAVMLLPSY